MGSLLSNLTGKRQQRLRRYSTCGTVGEGGGRAARRPRRPVGGGEEVADTGEVAAAGDSDGQADVAARAGPSERDGLPVGIPLFH